MRCPREPDHAGPKAQTNWQRRKEKTQQERPKLPHAASGPWPGANDEHAPIRKAVVSGIIAVSWLACLRCVRIVEDTRPHAL